METIVELCRDYYVLTLLLLYFTAGRLSILIAVVFSICPFWLCALLITGLEIVQVPVFYHFYSYMASFFRRIRDFILRRKAEDRVEGGIQDKAEQGFFASRFRPYGIPGIFVLSALPFKGCGVWSGILLGKTLSVDKKRLYSAVVLGLILGIVSITAFSIAARGTALSLVKSWDIDPSVRALFE